MSSRIECKEWPLSSPVTANVCRGAIQNPNGSVFMGSNRRQSYDGCTLVGQEGPKIDLELFRFLYELNLRTANFMRAVIQRVSRAKVTVKGHTTGEIGLGVMVLLGVGQQDGEPDADYLAQKIAALRIFEDADGKMNRSVLEVGGSVLAVSQFTLYGDVRKGNRPSFDGAAPLETARHLYERFIDRIRASGLRCETGRFQETMQVELVNEGPVTILLDSKKSF